jgi:hypothetical protein
VHAPFEIRLSVEPLRSPERAGVGVADVLGQIHRHRQPRLATDRLEQHVQRVFILPCVTGMSFAAMTLARVCGSGAPRFVGREVFALPREIDRETAYCLTVLGEPSGDCRYGRGIEAAGQRHAPRHVGNRLTGHDILEQLAYPCNRAVPAIGVPEMSYASAVAALAGALIAD